MRIGFFTDTYTPQVNGVVTSVRLFKSALEARGHQVFVFAPTPDQPGDDPDTVRFRSVPLLFQREMRFATPVSFEARRVIEAVDFDVVHAHDPFSIGLLGLSIARRRQIPYVHTYHTLYPEYVHYVWETHLTTRLAEVLSREYCDACDAIVAPSTKIERYLRSWGVTIPIEVIATGVDVGRFATADAGLVSSLRARLSLPAGTPVLLFVGRLGREKSVETLVRALWHCRNTQAVLLVVGDGPHRPEIEQLVRELGLSSRVRFAGYLAGAELVAVYHLSDLFVFSSTTETQGLVIAEAMAAGLPVVAVEDDAVGDFVDDGRTGRLVPGRPEGIALAIDGLLADSVTRSMMGVESAMRAATRSMGAQAARLEEYYLRAIDAYQPRGPFVTVGGFPRLAGRVVQQTAPRISIRRRTRS